jgi:hypothetical protein
MADLSEVENALVTLVASAIYPNGVGQPTTIGVKARIFPGWPQPGTLDADIAAGNVNISIFPMNGMERNTTRYPQQWIETTRQVPTVTATVSGVTLTLGGTPTGGNYVTVIAGQTAQTYILVAGYSLVIAATAVAALFPGATALGNVVTFPPPLMGRLTARVSAPSTVFKELKRQQRAFMVTIWAATPALRVAAASVVDPAMAAVDFVTLPDLTSAWLLYHKQDDVDRSETRSIYCRDLVYWVEYATTLVVPGSPITTTTTQIEADRFDAPDFTPLPWVSFNPIATRSY